MEGLKEPYWAYNIFRIFDRKRAFLSYNYYEHMAIKCVVVKFSQLGALILWRENEGAIA